MVGKYLHHRVLGQDTLTRSVNSFSLNSTQVLCEETTSLQKDWGMPYDGALLQLDIAIIALRAPESASTSKEACHLLLELNLCV
jgi:hypothetical protein